MKIIAVLTLSFLLAACSAPRASSKLSEQIKYVGSSGGAMESGGYNYHYMIFGRHCIEVGGLNGPMVCEPVHPSGGAE
jgi:hypothetical protein